MRKYMLAASNAQNSLVCVTHCQYQKIELRNNVDLNRACNMFWTDSETAM